MIFAFLPAMNEIWYNRILNLEESWYDRILNLENSLEVTWFYPDILQMNNRSTEQLSVLFGNTQRDSQ